MALPESPQYLISKGKQQEAKRILNRIAVTNGLPEGFLPDSHFEVNSVMPVDNQNGKKVPYTDVESAKSGLLNQEETDIVSHDNDCLVVSSDKGSLIGALCCKRQVRRSAAALGCAWFLAQIGSGW